MEQFIYILYQDNNPYCYENESFEVGYYDSLIKAYKKKKELQIKGHWEWFGKPKDCREYNIESFQKFWIEKVLLQ